MKSRFEIDQSEKGEYPLGAWATRNGMHFSFAHPGESCVLVLYRSGGKTPLAKLPFPREQRMGDVWSAAVAGDFAGVEYLYEVDGELKTDPCGRRFPGGSGGGI